jgi:hypothetical protein
MNAACHAENILPMGKFENFFEKWSGRREWNPRYWYSGLKWFKMAYFIGFFD